ncbi:zinc finger protein 511 lethal (2) k10201 [Anticarsia gemmatalis]|uniref:zinc finger protein 511 lethal (2) k10201 n=1 Tax=Anticarsia gemmatalis TaxID=129554 RepID=UPI003F7682B1
MENQVLLERITSYGVGRRKLDDVLFINDKPPPRLGVYDFDEENLCHEVIKSTCNIPGCTFTAESLLEYENHYNASHRYACGQCKKNLPSPHFLDLHIQEAHDSFFAVLAERKPSYCCYIEECKEKFKNADERLQHCIKEHKLPKDFRFESKPKSKNKKPKPNKKANTNDTSMEVDNQGSTSEIKKKIILTNSKQKTFVKYTGRKFTQNNKNNVSKDVNMDDVITDLKESLPE